MDTREPGRELWLVETRLHPPALQGDLIPRPRLLTQLHGAVTSRRLSIVSAPAGYGKTSLLTDLCHLHPDLSVAWLGLEEEDSDPSRFLTVLVAALQRLNPACGTAALTLLANLPSPGAEVRRVVAVLINDLRETLPDPFVLVLDDLHLISEPIDYLALDYLLEHLPSQMHLAVATRHDPPLALARLRARGYLAEFRLPDLRFNLEEVAAFCDRKPDLALSPDDVSALQSHTEGWPAGLRLACGSVAHIPAPQLRSAFIARLAEEGRHIFDFLADEVLSRQEQAVRTFLLETSILAELSPPTCEAVTQRHDAPAILDELCRRDLFLTAVDQGTTTFRYHALFGAFLRQRLQREMPERVAELHRRAAEAQAVPGRAIAHYLAAQLWTPAAVIVEQVADELLRQGLVDTLEGWINALPSETREARPRLTYLLGVCAWNRGQPKVAQPVLQSALSGFERTGDAVGEGEAVAHLAIAALLRGDFERSDALIHRALSCPILPRERVPLLVGRARLSSLRGDWTQAEADLTSAIEAAEGSGDQEALRLVLVHFHPTFLLLSGMLDRIEHLCDGVRAGAEGRVSPLQAAAAGQMAMVHLWRGRLGEAIGVGESVLEISRRFGGGYPFLDLTAVIAVALAYAARRDYMGADRCFDVGFSQTQQLGMGDAVIPGPLYVLGRVRWLERRFEDAREVYARMTAPGSAGQLPGSPVLRGMMRGLLEIADHRYAAAEGTLREAAALEQRVRTSMIFGSAQLLLAYLYLVWERHQEALAELAPPLSECERYGTPGLILKEGALVVPLLRLAAQHGVHAPYATHLLDLLHAAVDPAEVRVPETGETLSAREVEVLRLMADGYSNRDIAGRLIISEETAKSHVSHILRKLNVSSRTQAVTRALSLGIPNLVHQG